MTGDEIRPREIFIIRLNYLNIQLWCVASWRLIFHHYFFLVVFFFFLKSCEFWCSSCKQTSVCQVSVSSSVKFSLQLCMMLKCSAAIRKTGTRFVCMTTMHTRSSLNYLRCRVPFSSLRLRKFNCIEAQYRIRFSYLHFLCGAR